MTELNHKLVFGRECGECSVCCAALTINTSELKKLPDVLCPYCVQPAGCSIYDSRPSICKTWYCGWRQSDRLDDAWRPDRSGVLVEFVRDGLPWNYRRKTGVKLSIVGHPQVISWELLAGYAAGLIEVGVPVFLSAAGRFGHASGRAFLNDRMMGAVLSRDVSRVRRELINALEACMTHQGEQISFEN